MKKNFKVISTVSKLALILTLSTGVTACNNDSLKYNPSVSIDYMVNSDGKVVGTVGDIEIKDYEYRYFSRLSKLSLMQNLNNGVIIPKGSLQEKQFWESEFDGTTLGDYANKMTLDNLQQFKVLVTKADEKGVTLGEDDYKNVNNAIAFDANSIGENEKLENVIKDAYGITFSEYVSILQQSQLAYQYTLAAQKELEVTESDLRQVYDKNIDNMEKVTVVHVLFMYEDENGRTKEESKALAEDILKKVQDGEDIKQLAIENSEDGGITVNDGEYTFGRNDNLVPEFINWAFEAEIGDSDIVETYYGYHVMKLMDKSVTTFEEAEEELKADFQIEKFTNDFIELMESDEYKVSLDEDAIKKLK